MNRFVTCGIKDKLTVKDLLLLKRKKQKKTKTKQTKHDRFKGSRMSISVKASLWCVALLTNTGFYFFILE